MHSAIDRLRSLRVSDVMSRNVIEVSSHQTMQEAAAVLEGNDISSAPVVDDEGRCVGILSAADFLKRLGARGNGSRPGRMPGERAASQPEEPLRTAWALTDMTSHYMTSAVQSIASDVSLLTAARLMCAEHLHRLPVIDDRQRVVGVVSTMDIVAALLNAIDEMDTLAMNL